MALAQVPLPIISGSSGTPPTVSLVCKAGAQKSVSTVLAKYGTIDNIPDNHEQWVSDGVTVRGAEKLATTLRTNRTEAQLFKTLATLIRDVEVGEISNWKWNGPTDQFDEICSNLNCGYLVKRVSELK